MMIEEKKESYETNPKVDMKRIRMLANIMVTQRRIAISANKKKNKEKRSDGDM